MDVNGNWELVLERSGNQGKQVLERLWHLGDQMRFVVVTELDKHFLMEFFLIIICLKGESFIGEGRLGQNLIVLNRKISMRKNGDWVILL